MPSIHRSTHLRQVSPHRPIYSVRRGSSSTTPELTARNGTSCTSSSGSLACSCSPSSSLLHRHLHGIVHLQRSSDLPHSTCCTCTESQTSPDNVFPVPIDTACVEAPTPSLTFSNDSLRGEARSGSHPSAFSGFLLFLSQNLDETSCARSSSTLSSSRIRTSRSRQFISARLDANPRLSTPPALPAIP